MTLPANIRVNVRAPFPTRVKGAAFITVAKSNGVWSITPDYTVLAPSAGLTPTNLVAMQDSVTKAWSVINASLLAPPAYKLFANEALTVTAPNTLSNVLFNYSGGPVAIFVNGQAFFATGSQPAFTIVNQVITWNPVNAGVAIATTDVVNIFYTHS